MLKDKPRRTPCGSLSMIETLRLVRFAPMLIEVRATVVTGRAPYWARQDVSFAIHQNNLPFREDFDSYDGWVEAIMALSPVKLRSAATPY